MCHRPHISLASRCGERPRWRKGFRPLPASAWRETRPAAVRESELSSIRRSLSCDAPPAEGRRILLPAERQARAGPAGSRRARRRRRPECAGSPARSDRTCTPPCRSRLRSKRPDARAGLRLRGAPHDDDSRRMSARVICFGAARSKPSRSSSFATWSASVWRWRSTGRTDFAPRWGLDDDNSDLQPSSGSARDPDRRAGPVAGLGRTGTKRTVWPPFAR
jgi:hypothetical protein